MWRKILRICSFTTRPFRVKQWGAIGLMLVIFIITQLTRSAPNAFGASPLPSPEWITENIDSLRSALLIDKEIAEDFEQSILAALSYFPDLKDVCIRFRKRAIGTTMAALPSPGSFFAQRGNRCYLVLINMKQNEQKAPLIKEAPFGARVGVIAHELGHIVDYESKSMLRILGNGIAYAFSSRFRYNLEQRIDSIAIARGAGMELKEFRLFVEEHPDVTPRYLRFKRRYYMTSDEIATILNEGCVDEEEDG